eukprot:gb/GEZJ01005163.1/.p1 GENE.gb/GEZJ01005163.1/~~gb/GEZJ01005163.1/.p1  ORF type:complete len:147 (+),score=8.98 gb/GEZJ01005163.1/:699-1139(+)
MVFCLFRNDCNASESTDAHVCVVVVGMSGSTAAFFLSRLSSISISVLLNMADQYQSYFRVLRRLGDGCHVVAESVQVASQLKMTSVPAPRETPPYKICQHASESLCMEQILHSFFVFSLLVDSAQGPKWGDGIAEETYLLSSRQFG